MKKHVCIILLCVLVLFIIVLLEFIGYKNGDFKLNASYIVPTIIFGIWVMGSPMAYYTFFRILNSNDGSEYKLYNLCITCDSIIGYIFIPVLLSPILLIDYIKIFKEDLAINKEN